MQINIIISLLLIFINAIWCANQLTPADIKFKMEQESSPSVDIYAEKVKFLEAKIVETLKKLKDYAKLIKNYKTQPNTQKTVERLVGKSVLLFSELESYKSQLADEYYVLNQIDKIKKLEKRQTPPGGAPLIIGDDDDVQ